MRDPHTAAAYAVSRPTSDNLASRPHTASATLRGKPRVSPEPAASTSVT